MPVPVFAFDQVSFGEAFEAEGCDVYSLGNTIQDQLYKAGARRRGGLEACAAQPAGEVEAVQSGGAVDRALVGGDAIPPDVDGVQAALFDLGNALDHGIDELFEEREGGRLVFGVRRLAAQGLVFARRQDEGAALGTEVAVDDVVDRRREFAERRRTVEKGDIMGPRLEWDVDVSEACDLLRPRPRGVDDNRCIEIAFGGAHTCHAPA